VEAGESIGGQGDKEGGGQVWDGHRGGGCVDGKSLTNKEQLPIRKRKGGKKLWKKGCNRRGKQKIGAETIAFGREKKMGCGKLHILFVFRE